MIFKTFNTRNNILPKINKLLVNKGYTRQRALFSLIANLQRQQVHIIILMINNLIGCLVCHFLYAKFL